jgi:hypothetical protein
VTLQRRLEGRVLRLAVVGRVAVAERAQHSLDGGALQGALVQRPGGLGRDPGGGLVDDPGPMRGRRGVMGPDDPGDDTADVRDHSDRHEGGCAQHPSAGDHRTSLGRPYSHVMGFTVPPLT